MYSRHSLLTGPVCGVHHIVNKVTQQQHKRLEQLQHDNCSGQRIHKHIVTVATIVSSEWFLRCKQIRVSSNTVMNELSQCHTQGYSYPSNTIYSEITLYSTACVYVPRIPGICAMLGLRSAN